MSDYRDPATKALLGVLRAIQKAEGYEFCDICEDILVDEAMRCDFCCGQFGIPSQEEIKKWIEAHPGYLERMHKRWNEEAELEETGDV